MKLVPLAIALVFGISIVSRVKIGWKTDLPIVEE